MLNVFGSKIEGLVLIFNMLWKNESAKYRVRKRERISKEGILMELGMRLVVLKTNVTRIARDFVQIVPSRYL